MDFTPDSYRYRVHSAVPATPVIRELRLEPIEGELPFRAGQFVLLADARDRIPQRSYSIANAPRADGRLSLLVTLVPGGRTSTWAQGLAPDDEVSIEGPFGTFTRPDDRAQPVLLLGAGSRSAGAGARQASAADADAEPGGRDTKPVMAPAAPVTLFFSARTHADAIDRSRFEALSAALPHFDYRLTCTREERSGSAGRRERIPRLLAAEFESLANAAVFAAGPPGFVAGCRDAAIALAADPADVRTEEFFAEDA